MISPDYVSQFARYTRWQNDSLYREAGTLSEAERLRDRGAFFKSIQGTLNHLLWADTIWLHRLTGTPMPRMRTLSDSPFEFTEFNALRTERQRLDQVILDWANRLDPQWLQGDLTWTTTAGDRTMSKPKWLLVTHMFNHGTHHRGQVHAMLTAAGCNPDVTDLPFMPSA
jgi:uncharacterized damage-inducible protein DinB